MLIHKDPIPRTHGYVLRSRRLEDALQAAGIEVEILLTHGSGRVLFVALFWPPGPVCAHDRLHLRAGCVPVAQVHAARRYVEDAVLPEFAEWAKALLALPRNAPVRQREQVFSRELSPGILRRYASPA